MSIKRIIAIAAMDESRIIGWKGRLPWDIPSDLKRFRELTTGHTVLMGRKTFESLPPKVRPLPNRVNVVVSSIPGYPGAGYDVYCEASPHSVIESFRAGDSRFKGDILWVIGGARIYQSTCSLWDEVVLTLVKGRHQGDVYFPVFEDAFEVVERETGDEFDCIRYKRKQSCGGN